MKMTKLGTCADDNTFEPVHVFELTFNQSTLDDLRSVSSIFGEDEAALIVGREILNTVKNKGKE